MASDKNLELHTASTLRTTTVCKPLVFAQGTGKEQKSDSSKNIQGINHENFLFILFKHQGK
jgi:hypothetical protein